MQLDSGTARFSTSLSVLFKAARGGEIYGLWQKRLNGKGRRITGHDFLPSLIAFCAVVLHVGTAAAEDKPPCFDDFSGKLAKELSDCIKEMRDDIAKLQKNPNASFLAAGTFDEKAEFISGSGPFKARAAFVPTSAQYYTVTLEGPFPFTRNPIVVVGPIKQGSEAVAQPSDEYNKFLVTTYLAGQPVREGFWFLVFSAEPRP